MYIVVREWGEYSDKGSHCVAASETLEGAEQIIILFKKIEEFNTKLSAQFRVDFAEFEKTISPEKPPIFKPKKSEIDPKNKISQGDWERNYLNPWRKAQTEIDDYNTQLHLAKQTYYKNYIKNATIPVEFVPFKNYIAIDKYGWSLPEYTYSIEEVPLV